MANYCYNQVTVTVEPAAPKAEANTQLLTLHTAISLGHGELPEDADIGYAWLSAALGEEAWAEIDPSSGVDFNVWLAFTGGTTGSGTKWVSFGSVDGYEPGGDSLSFTFDSAWSPAYGVVEALSKTFPLLHFSHFYEEPGNGFAGSVELSGGEPQSHETADLYSYYLDEDEDDEACLYLWTEGKILFHEAATAEIYTSYMEAWNARPEVMVMVEKFTPSPAELRTLLSKQLGEDEDLLMKLTERNDWEELAPVVAEHFKLPTDLPAEWISAVI